MALRNNHYDLAFEAWLREGRWPYVSVDESRRSLLAQASLKSFDFIVSPPDGERLLVDVKGRRFPGAGGSRWENWATEDDVRSLLAWEQVFGSGFRAALVFAYALDDERGPSRHAERFLFRGRAYAFYVVWVREFAAAMTRRSQRWETVNLPAAAYRQVRQPLSRVLGSRPPVREALERQDVAC